MSERPNSLWSLPSPLYSFSIDRCFKLSHKQPAYRTRASNSMTTGTASQLGTDIHENGKEPTTQGDRLRDSATIDEPSLENLPPTPTRHGISPGAARVESSGPSLPSTPSQLEPEAPRKRPKGTLFSIPSKRTRKKKGRTRGIAIAAEGSCTKAVISGASSDIDFGAESILT